MTTNLDYSQNTYLAITLSSSNPSNIVSLHPALTHVGQVGQLKDVQMFSVPKTVWESNIGDEIKGILEGQKGRDEGVIRIDVQEMKQRVKRGGEEL
ncbi:hypothetical protein Moror_8318 [Moniliophthora roreri MCA 2997]|uniref:Uncharacterized protein n=1 Tax=Moniliophthora roreri (strain MCA 2997) TaxID=1381753 RepID=V2X4Z1_MONRO|nr:hypothetical protein Moror_8318 [Moniliophthora roreri MCA 2997]